MDKGLKKIMFPAQVVDNQDPYVLGRIRSYPLDQNIRATLEAYNFDFERDAWGPNDPFVQMPLLPMFIAQVPLIGERVNLIYQNSFFPFQDQYYVQGAFSSPMTLPYEQLLAANANTSLGDRVKSTLALKNLDGTYQDVKSRGVFPEPGDNALLGRGAADVIVKPDTVMLRAGKTKRLDVNKQPIGNPNRAFVQVSDFTNKTVNRAKQSFLTLQNVNQQIKKLIEWEIINLENEQGIFTGAVRLYGLKAVPKTLSDNISFDSNLEDVKSLEFYQPFVTLSFQNAVEFINNFILGCNNGQIPNGPAITNQFPLVYRPNLAIRNILTQTTSTSNPVVFSNASKFTNSITLNPGLGATSYTFAIVRERNQVGKPIKVNVEEITQKDVESTYGTYGGMGADTLFLLSYLSNKPVDLEGTLYGISQDDLLEKILPQTSSMVRGEELIDLLNLIVRFLVSHVHAMPGVAPVPVGTDGSSVNNILFQLQNAANKVLNPNIRIN